MRVTTSPQRASRQKPSKGKSAAHRRSWKLRIVKWVLAGLGAFYAIVALALVYLRFLPPLTTGVQIERRIESLVAGKPYQKRYSFVPLKSISPDLQHAVVAAEDARFYDHHGIDWKEVVDVAEEGLERGQLRRGASTISQQLVKNIFLTTHRNGVRKVAEFLIVPVAELMLPKQRILELYLNVVEWGPGVYGAEAAARHHLNTPASRLTREQAARLAAVLPAPLTRRPARMNDYSGAILTRMRQMGW